ncbi:MAG: hypothetical protein K5872_06370 [Rhizobiaceae bacterium]|nr:hypothetical protein [Rhizobiaceae bacterium]MCV0405838.1 hypothetical protein [Rhizobiaceae bacterium]
MARRNASLGFFGMFGRSEDLRALDRALRDADLHPALVPEGVKLTVVNLMKDAYASDEPPPEAYRRAADLLAYCVGGAEAFEGAVGTGRLRDVERRIEAAIDHDGGYDAELVLLALHSRLISPEVVERFDLRAEG